MRWFCLLLALCGLVGADAQLRVVTWNVSNYGGGRVSAFQTAIYATFEDRSLAPDVIVCQEFTNVTGYNQFLQALNTAPNSPGDWAAAPFINGADTESVMYYRTSKGTLIGASTVAVGSSSSSNQPRNTYRYDLQLKGYPYNGGTVAIYAVHMKAGITATDQTRRQVEAQRIRTNAESLPIGWSFMVVGDFNVQSSSDPGYIPYIESRLDNRGRFFDPISSPGAWQNNPAFRFIHTQDPALNSAGMDDRYDQILISGNLIDGRGLEYRGMYGLPYSTTTWNDENHSYRCWGNDGTTYNLPMRIAGNTMVGPTIAQALLDSLGNQNGHLPVFLEILAPPRIEWTREIDLGYVDVGSPRSFDVNVQHAGDVALWGLHGMADLQYNFKPQPGFVVPEGLQVAAAGDAPNTHVMSFTPDAAGRFERFLLIAHDDPTYHDVVVKVTGVGVGTLPSRR